MNKRKRFYFIYLVIIILVFIFGLIIGKESKCNIKKCKSPLPYVVEEIIIREITTPKYSTYSINLLDKKTEIIKDKKEFEELLKPFKLDNENDNKNIEKLEEDYKSFDFENNSLLFLNASGSGCTSNINLLNKISYKDDKIIVTLDNKSDSDEVTCMWFISKLYVIEIEKGNYSEVVIK